jgi:hypothetical protein
VQVARLLEQSLADAGEDPGAGTIDRRSFLTGRERAARADRALLDAGIHPGDPSLSAPPPAALGDDRGV